jgi:hypothetical protein
MSFVHNIGMCFKKLTKCVRQKPGIPEEADGMRDSVSHAVSERGINVDIKCLTYYFRQTLRQSDLTAPKLSDYVEVSSAAINGKDAAARLSTEDCERLFEKYRKRNNLNTDKRSAADEKPISVLISLVTFRDTTASHETFIPLLILPAKLAPDGELMPDSNNLPWINVERMHRSGVADEELMVGGDDALHRFWTYFNDHKDDERTEWRDCLTDARRMFEAVAGKSLENWANEKNKALEALRREAESKALESRKVKEGHAGTGSTVRRAGPDPSSSVIVDKYYVVEGERIVASAQIQRLYQFLEERDNFPQLYKNLLSTARRDYALGSEKLAGDIALDFTGTMSDEFPLTETQRIAVRGFFCDREGDVTAISGPPGTGKTTMLQAIVASTLVNHALAKADPPLIIGTSTNNQAVTNIIESFGSVANDAKDSQTKWGCRWIVEASEGYDENNQPIKRLGSLAVYCPSAAKVEEARKKGYLVEDYLHKNGVYKTYSDDHYAKKAHDRFLEFAHEAFDMSFTSAPQVEEAIWKQLRRINNLSRQLVYAYDEYLNGKSDENVRKYVTELDRENALGTSGKAGKFSKLIDPKCRNSRSNAMDKLDRLLDTTVRYTQFWLAVHYYEAQWVGREEDNSYLSPDQRNNNPENVEEYFEQAAALTPCFVMTEYQIPKWMGAYTKEMGRHFILGRADLLIVDEAGQVDTCVGAAAFALAKRAIVVGDEHQLSPIWKVEPKIDEAIVGSLGIDAWESLRERGLTCSEPSSIMRAAGYASNWGYGPNKEGKILPGLFLAEHFRCHPLIINYCNELIYDGMLKPRRPMPSQVIEQLKQRAADGNPLDGEPEKAAVNDNLDDNGLSEAYRLLKLISNPLLFVTVPGSESQRVGCSRKNPVEARAIASWIDENGDFLAHIYGKELGQTIAVVTPFAAQAKCISDALVAKIGNDRAQRVTVGTAHRLQGAERPVVLFSCGYGNNDADARFVNETLELMNVAVSRAKDLFVIFGAQARWEDRGTVFHLVHKLAEKSDGHLAQAREADVVVDNTTSDVAESTIRIAPDSGVVEPVTTKTGDPSATKYDEREKFSPRRYLKVPIKERDEVKKLGARFDQTRELWYVTDDADTAVFERWSVYLNVPYEQNGEAKQLGALWDWKKRYWYAPAGADLSNFKRWL